VRRRRSQPLHGRNLTPDSILHLLERVHLDLAHPLARDSKFLREPFERDRLVGETARFEDAPLAAVGHREASTSALRLLSKSSVSTSTLSWLGVSSTIQSCHSPESSSSRIGVLSEASRLTRRVTNSRTLVCTFSTSGDPQSAGRPRRTMNPGSWSGTAKRIAQTTNRLSWTAREVIDSRHLVAFTFRAQLNNSEYVDDRFRRCFGALLRAAVAHILSARMEFDCRAEVYFYSTLLNL
jgi:hypothetical protein